MTVAEWQAQFIAAVQSRRFNTYPPAMINSLLEEEADAEAFATKAKAFFSKYETDVVTSSGGVSNKDPLSPRSLWLLLGAVGTTVSAAMLTEGGKPVENESGGSVIQLEKGMTPSEE